GTLAMILATGATGVVHGRKLLAQVALGQSPDNGKLFPLFRGLALQLDTGLLASLAGAAVGLALIAALAASLLRPSARRPWQLLVLLLTLPLQLAMCAALHYEKMLVDGLIASLAAAGDPSHRSQQLLDVFAHGQRFLDGARAGVLTAAAAA